MSGRVIVIGMLVIALAAGALLWWTQTRAFYVEVDGVGEIEIAGTAFAVRSYEGIDAESSPIKMRGCFEMDASDVDAALAAGADLTAEAIARKVDIVPLTAPDWFECFDAEAVGTALERGEATAVVAERGAADGVDRIVVLWPDGRGVTWRQLNEKYAE